MRGPRKPALSSGGLLSNPCLQDTTRAGETPLFQGEQ